MAVAQPARSWLATFAFSTTLALSSPCVTCLPPPEMLSEHHPLTRHHLLPPATLATSGDCCYCRSGCGAFNGHRPSPFAHDRMDGKQVQSRRKESDILGSRAFAIHEADVAREPESLWRKARLEPFTSLINRSDVGHLVAHASARDRIWALRKDPRIAALLAAERFDYQKKVSKDRPMQAVDLYLIHALGVTGGNRFIEAVTNRPSPVQSCCW